MQSRSAPEVLCCAMLSCAPSRWPLWCPVLWLLLQHERSYAHTSTHMQHTRMGWHPEVGAMQRGFGLVKVQLQLAGADFTADVPQMSTAHFLLQAIQGRVWINVHGALAGGQALGHLEPRLHPVPDGVWPHTICAPALRAQDARYC